MSTSSMRLTRVMWEESSSLYGITCNASCFGYQGKNRLEIA